jgi:hypothetical protein
MQPSSHHGRAKGSRLVGGAVTEEALDVSASVNSTAPRVRAPVCCSSSRRPRAAVLAARVITGEAPRPRRGRMSPKGDHGTWKRSSG